MIPDNRFSSINLPASTDLPPQLNIMHRQTFGPIHLQDPSKGFFYQIWNIRAEDFSVYVSAPNYSEALVFTRIDRVRNVSLAFDTNANPCIAFESGGNSWFYWYDPVPNAYVFLDLGSASYPYAVLDDGRESSQNTRDVILAYIRDGYIFYRQLRDRFTIEYTPTIGDTGLAATADILYFIGMQDNYRLQFVYGYLPTFFDTPNIMKDQIIPQKSPAEILDIAFDFQHVMMLGDSISTGLCVITVDSGLDPDAASMLVGDPTHTTRTLIQTVQGGLPGVIYRLSMSVRTVNECVYVVEGLLSVNNSPAEIPEVV